MVKYKMMIKLTLRGEMVEKQTYIQLMYDRCKEYFKLEENKQLLNESFELYGKYQMLLGRTLVTQKDIIDQFETNEYLLFKCIDRLDTELLAHYMTYIQTVVNEVVKLHKYHRSTYINLVLVCDELATDLDMGIIKRFKAEKIYKFYLQGFSEVRLIVVDLQNKQVVVNKAAKGVKKAYMPS